jgi:hypothetical protein
MNVLLVTCLISIALIHSARFIWPSPRELVLFDQHAAGGLEESVIESKKQPGSRTTQQLFREESNESHNGEVARNWSKHLARQHYTSFARER